MHDFARALKASLVGGLTVFVDLLDVAVAHAADEPSRIEELLQARLHPDMFPFWRQVVTGCNVARRCVDRLGGKEIHDPKKPEATVEGLRAHLHETIAYVQGADDAVLDATESSPVEAKLGKEAVGMTGRTYLLCFAQPNMLFHVVTAYDILRHHGVAVGKHGYLRPMVMQGAR